MKTNAFAFVVVLALACTVHPAYAQFNYVTNDGTITVTGYTGPGGDVEIPSTIDGLPVTSIGEWAFGGCDILTSVTIGNSVTTIGQSAFYGCTSLTRVHFQGNAPGLGSSVFLNANNATVFYLPGTTGWGPTFGGRPTAFWRLPYPVILDVHESFGIQTNHFGFGMSWATNADVVVEACTNLTSLNWSPVATNTLTDSHSDPVDPQDGWSYFSDPDGTNDPARFYRVVGLAAPAGMALIPAGNFTMGDYTWLDGDDDELPLHTVYVSAFYMDTHEVTKALWDEVKGWNDGNAYSYDNGGSGKAANHPVQLVNWYDCVKWCNARSQKEALMPCYYTDAALTIIYKTGRVAPYVNWSANGYRLPTEAEWEKAARGGAEGDGRFPGSPGSPIMYISHSSANYYAGLHTVYDRSYPAGYHPAFNDGVNPYTSPVGYFAANGYGLYDMAGNVAEWCWDWYLGTYYSYSPGTDPRGPPTGGIRLVRGGNWGDSSYAARCSYRGTGDPFWTPSYLVGFRCVRGL